MTLINQEINRATHCEIVRQIHSDVSPWKESVALASEAFQLTNFVLDNFSQSLSTFLKKFYRDEARLKTSATSTLETTVKASLQPTPAAPGEEELSWPPNDSTKRLGGIIAWFEAEDKLGEHVDGTAQENRRLFRLSDKRLTGAVDTVEIDSYLLWRRGDRNWRYTFFEGNSDYENSTLPNRNAEVAQHLDDFFRRLFSSLKLQCSFPDLRQQLGQHDTTRVQYPFPGVRTSGAQYFLVPAELLLVIAQHMALFVGRYIPSHKEVFPAFDSNIQTSLQNLFRVDTLSRASPVAGQSVAQDGAKTRRAALEQLLVQINPAALLDESTAEQTSNQNEMASTDIDANLKLLDELRVYVQDLHGRVGAADGGNDIALPQLAQSFNESFVKLAEALWRIVYKTEKPLLGHDDFVASTVIDGRAIYFSNFRSYGPEGFTRTFFIDFCFSPYQRGRLVRRLCEIATHRMSCVMDFTRFNALQDAINTTTAQFNEFASNRMKHAEDGPEPDASLNAVLNLYQTVLQLNSFITEGVAARRRAIEADWHLVRRQVADIRERRISGYAQLGDFLNRGLALSVIEAGIVADRYENLLQRIRDYTSILRTKLMNSFERTVAALLKNQQGAADALARSMNYQVNLLLAADILVVAGGVYYVTSMAEKLMGKSFELNVIPVFLSAFFAVVIFHFLYTGRFFFDVRRIMVERKEQMFSAYRAVYALFRKLIGGE